MTAGAPAHTETILENEGPAGHSVGHKNRICHPVPGGYISENETGNNNSEDPFVRFGDPWGGDSYRSELLKPTKPPQQELSVFKAPEFPKHILLQTRPEAPLSQDIGALWPRGERQPFAGKGAPRLDLPRSDPDGCSVHVVSVEGPGGSSKQVGGSLHAPVRPPKPGPLHYDFMGYSNASSSAAQGREPSAHSEQQYEMQTRPLLKDGRHDARPMARGLYEYSEVDSVSMASSPNCL